MKAAKTSDPGIANLQIIEELYAKFKRDAKSVDPLWRQYFRDLDLESKPVPQERLSSQPLPFDDHRVSDLIDGYRTFGHLFANANPLVSTTTEVPIELRLETFGLQEADLDREFATFGLMEKQKAPLLHIIQLLKAIYCDRIGIEYMETHSPEMEQWLQQQIEPNCFRDAITIDQKKMILQQLNKSELFESFLHTKYVGQKRFSLEGGETFIPIMEEMIETGARLGVEEVVIGMAHRGRLNVLSNILHKSYKEIFTEFEEGYIPDSFEGSGDVKYHKGYSAEVSLPDGKKMSILLTPNPSHLESVDPVVEGQVLAKQILKQDVDKQEKVVPLLVHGDAALSGQGVIYETLQFWKIPGYATGGTIHLVINNQIGFTTLPSEGRSTTYCTDIALAFGAPVFHVNAEDPEGCIFAANLAIKLRQKFHCDVFIDLICYRKYGHNESDEPAFTQPLEYQKIRKKKGIREIYRDKLIADGKLEKQIAESLEQDFKKTLQMAIDEIKLSASSQNKQVAPRKTVFKAETLLAPLSTKVNAETLRSIAQKLCQIPDGFTIHPKIGNLLKERLAMVDEKPSKLIDWGMGELLAYGSLLWDGTPVRLSGQDSARGTFSHRHAVWVDQIKEWKYCALAHLKEGQGRFDVYNSPLSEYAVLGFEFGYSVAYPETLVLWEAQFGDFCNGAQIIIDQYIASSEQKWGVRSGLVLLLPHGYEGQGPEHSSARMERFLALAGRDNMQIIVPTSPAQLFHLLRRQMLSPVKKPLVVFTPKGLLRHPECVSKFSDLSDGSFQGIIDDPNGPKEAKRLVFCTGRIYYDLMAARTKYQDSELVIVRIEELYPLNHEKIQEIIKRYQAVQEYIWVQEEPANMGAWGYIHSLLADLLPNNSPLKYIGRKRSASPAAGSYALHKHEHAELLNELFKRETNDES